MDITSQFLTLGDLKIPIYKAGHIKEEILCDVIDCKKFKEWVSNIDHTSLNIISLSILNVFMFGKIVGFVDLVLDCSLKTGKRNVKIPGFVFLRGGAVAMLLILNKEFVIITKQFRVPVGKFLLEAPAGMLDESGDFSGVAAKEIEEECGLKINCKDLVDLGYIYSSPGGSDEKIHLFSIDITMNDQELKNILDKIHGSEHEGEQIELKVINFTKKDILQTNDSKLINAAFAYETLNKISIKF